MEFKNIKVRSEQTIGFVQIDRVAEKNSLDIETSKEILQALQNFDQDNAIKCIAIEGWSWRAGWNRCASPTTRRCRTSTRLCVKSRLG